MSMVTNYIISLTYLYGIVHRDKVVEIYNMHHEEDMTVAELNEYLLHNITEINKHFVELYGDYFVHESIMEFDEFEIELAKRRGKPFYIPNQGELLKYKDDLYFERTPEFKALLKYVEKNFYKRNKNMAEMLCEDVHDECQMGTSISDIFDPFNRRGIEFENEEQVKEVMDLVMDLSNHVRLWQNNGFTPAELRHVAEQPKMNPLPEQDNDRAASNATLGGTTNKKVGRNEPCPCGSGKKYKKCCLNKE